MLQFRLRGAQKRKNFMENSLKFRCALRHCVIVFALCAASTGSLSAVADTRENITAPDAGEGLRGPACGNSILDPGEQCDDGNGAPGDGCSDTCQVEPGFECTLPVPANTTNLVQDPGFEAGPFGGVWEEFSKNFGTPICDETECGEASQRSGLFWAWFGGINGTIEVGSVAQTITLPTTVTEATFWLRARSCELPEDYVELRVDDNQVWALFGDDMACGGENYQEITVDISAFADGGMHEIKFHSETFFQDSGFTDFFLDDVSIPQGPLVPIPSECVAIAGFIFGDGFETLVR